MMEIEGLEIGCVGWMDWDWDMPGLHAGYI